MRKIVRLALLCVFAGSACFAFSQPGVNTAWRCWYDGETTVLCLLRGATRVPGKADARDVAMFPMLHAIRNAPASVDGPVLIPLHAIPFDLDFVKELVQSVMCGRKPDCTVSLGSPDTEVAGSFFTAR